MKKEKVTFIIGSILIVLLAITAVFGFGSIKGANRMRFGIDIRGGVEAVYEPVDLDRAPEPEELESARTVIESRLDANSILDREVTTDNEHGTIIVRFPWKSGETEFNPEKAIAELGETARLTFRDAKGNVLLDGSYVRKSSSLRSPQNNFPIVTLELDSDGKKIFAEITEKLLNQRLYIFMDEEEIFSGTVSSVITDGQAQIQGLNSMEAAEDLSKKINAGALPFSMATTNHSSISPSLGSGALNVMIRAGLVAFAAVCLFMIFYYRLPGIISCIALVFQMSCQLLFLSVPQVTLTLPGIAGLILSLGMAVDANIIISERISEEMQKGKSIRASIKEGYKNAFSSVLDGNLTSAIVAVILMFFGSGTMYSFGYTLLTGVILNFLVVVISKKLLNSALDFRILYKESLFRQKKERKTIHFYEKKQIPLLLSTIMIIAGILVCVIKGITLDTSFIGGAILKYNYQGEIDIAENEKAAAEAINRPVSIQMTTDLVTEEKKMVVTLAGNEGLSPEEQLQLFDALSAVNPTSELTLSESYIVEPYIGRQALVNSVKAIVLASIFIVIYVAIRFSSISGISAGVMALVALVHDILFVLFVFAVFSIPLNDAFVAVTLTIIGYSINDTIVIYDRIRENTTIEKLSLKDLLNLSVTQSMSRSINTTITTATCILLVFVFAYVYGIQSIVVFSLPMFFGLLSGCYSTICIAGSLWVTWKSFREKKSIAEKA